MLVCGNTADMLSQTRYGRHFTINGDKSAHFGLFDCAPASAPGAAGDAAQVGCC